MSEVSAFDAVLPRLQQACHTATDLEVLRRAYLAGQISIASGERAVAIGGSADDLRRLLADIKNEFDLGNLHDNPYLGLASYTHATQALYGGREPRVREAVARLTAAGDEPLLFFITGASGSGKSSFAQAGLLPALEQGLRPSPGSGVPALVASSWVGRAFTTARASREPDNQCPDTTLQDLLGGALHMSRPSHPEQGAG